jgi:hypothetical protein
MQIRIGGISSERASTHMRPTTRSEIVASVKHARRNAKALAVPAFPQLIFALSLLERGRSSVVERQLPKLYVEGSIPFARSNSL